MLSLRAISSLRSFAPIKEGLRQESAKRTSKYAKKSLNRRANFISSLMKNSSRFYSSQYIEPTKKVKRAIGSENRPILTLPEGVERPKKLSRAETNKAWTELGLDNPSIIAALEEMGHTEPTLIQQLVIPKLTSKETQEMLFADQTGTGKTLAYLLPVIQALKNDEQVNGRNELAGRPRAVVLVPNRELANQVLKVAKKVCHSAKLRCGVVSGGETVSQQRSTFGAPVDILIATPGRLIQHVERKRIFFSKVSHVVMDEVDMLLDDMEGGFAQDVFRVVDNIKNRVEQTKEQLKIVCCGATLTRTLLSLIDSKFPNIHHILSPTLHKSVAKLEQYWIPVAADKQAKLLELLHREYPLDGAAPETKKIKRTIIFCNTINSCRYLDHTLRERGFETVSYHGEIPVDQRARNFAEFSEGISTILVCTDIASRGLDFVSVDHVVLFDFPLNSIDYLHRIGRTARGGKSGKVTNFVMKRDLVLSDAIRDAIHRGKSLESLSASDVENQAARRGTL